MLFTNHNKEIKKFHNEFGIRLSTKTKIIYNESIFGWFGDGEGLIVYNVSPKDMKEIIKQDEIIDWSELPISELPHKQLYKKFGIDSGEIKKYLNLDAQEGFYAVIDRSDSSSNKLLSQEHLDRFKFYNFTLGIIDTKDNKIYLYEYSQ